LKPRLPYFDNPYRLAAVGGFGTSPFMRSAQKGGGKGGGVRGEAPSTAWHLSEMVRRLLAFPFGGKVSGGSADRRMRGAPASAFFLGDPSTRFARSG